MIVLWTWDAAAPGAAGSGVCDDENHVRRAASAWMRAHGAAACVATQVRLGVGSRTLMQSHEPTGITLTGRLDRDGRVRWESARDAA